MHRYALRAEAAVGRKPKHHHWLLLLSLLTYLQRHMEAAIHGLRVKRIIYVAIVILGLVKYFILYLPQWQFFDFGIKLEVVMAFKINFA